MLIGFGGRVDGQISEILEPKPGGGKTWHGAGTSFRDRNPPVVSPSDAAFFGVSLTDRQRPT